MKCDVHETENCDSPGCAIWLPKIPAQAIYSVYCHECDWFGMSDDCMYGRCPVCKERVKQKWLKERGK